MGWRETLLEKKIPMRRPAPMDQTGELTTGSLYYKLIQNLNPFSSIEKSGIKI